MVAGYAIGGGHVLHLVCDLTIAADNARFGQVGPKVGSFDGGFGAALLADLVGVKKAKEIWFLCRQYGAAGGAGDGARQHGRAARAAGGRRPSPGAADARAVAVRAAAAEGELQRRRGRPAGIQQLAHDANLLFYGSEEAQEGRDAYREKRTPDFSRFPSARPMRMMRAANERRVAGHRRASSIWVMAARVRTLPAAIAPVLVGTSLALGAGTFHPLAFLAALLGAMFIQVGTNLSNDYSDARRGADSEDRLGPVRVTAGGLVPPRQVLIATYARSRSRSPAAPIWSRSPAGSCWRSARRRSSPACSTPGARGHTATRDSASCSCSCSSGSSRSSAPTSCRCRPALAGVRCAVPVGLLASAILVVNNVRDIDTDRRAGKRTLAVRLGRERTRTAVRGDARRRVRRARRCRGRSGHDAVAAALLAGDAARARA